MPATLPEIPIRLAFTATELVTLATLEDLELPEGVTILSPRSTERWSPEPAGIEEAIASLFARGFLASAESHPLIAEQFAGLLELICHPEWTVDAVRVAQGTDGGLWHIAGRGEAGALLEGHAPDGISLVYRPDARRQVVPTLLDIDRLNQPASSAGDGEPITLNALRESDRWDTRVTYGAAFTSIADEYTESVEWVRLAELRYQLEGSSDGVAAKLLGDAELRELLESAFAHAVGQHL